MKIAVIGNYPPRQCGIATFTQNFVESLLMQVDSSKSTNYQIDVFAMNDKVAQYDYPLIVKKSIPHNNKESYYEVVNLINQGNYDYCHIQHEFGIYGGHSGLFVSIFLTQIKIPIFVTLHSVLKRFNFHQKSILENLALFSTKIIVMSQFARKLLTCNHDIPDEKISVIQHGAPVFEKLVRVKIKKVLGWSNFTIIMTFGLIGRSKGIETVLRALPEVCKYYPNVRYVILGKTHPNIVKQEGEDYREYLIQLAKDQGISEKIIMLDKYVSETELMSYLKASDIYDTPYLNEAQITSGTLAYAVSSGSAVISTPYWHAVELLANGRGLLFDFYSSNQLEKAIINLLDQPSLLQSFQKAAFDYGQTISWPAIGKEVYLLVQNTLSKGSWQRLNTEEILLKAVPEFSLVHFQNLTDSTGLLQHASYSIPNFNHGYCTDDNARALIMAIKLNKNTHSKDSEKLITKFLSFLKFMQKEDGSFVNMLGYSRNHLSNNNSEDTFGRTIWALGYTIKYAPLYLQKEFAFELFHKAIFHFTDLNDLRGVASMIIGTVFYLKERRDDTTIQLILEKLTLKLFTSYQSASDNNWHWFEEKISYDNALLPLAMYNGAVYLRKPEYFEVAEQSMNFLESFSYNNGHLSLIGNEKWLEKGQNKSMFCQQPIDAMAFILLYHYLYKLTNEDAYKNKVKTTFSWFLGNNDLCTSLYDKQTNGCADGLSEVNLNLNQGGESILAWLISYLTYQSMD